MAAAPHICIKGYEGFLEHLYESWDQKENAFYNPKNRMRACSIVIGALIAEKRNNDAILLFEECNKLGAWEYKPGRDFEEIARPGVSKEAAILRIQTICNNLFNDACGALENAGIILNKR